MEITRLTQDTEVWNKEKEVVKIKYTQDIPFLEARKIVETTFPAQPYSSNATYTKPFSSRLPEEQSSNEKTCKSETERIPNLS